MRSLYHGKNKYSLISLLVMSFLDNQNITNNNHFNIFRSKSEILKKIGQLLISI